MSNNTKHIIDIISDSVDNLRKTNTILSIVNITGYDFAIVFDNENEYSVGDYLTLNNGANDYKNVLVLSTSMTHAISVRSLDNNDLTDAISSKGNAPYFSFEHWQSEASQLLMKDQTIKYRNQKYPLVFLLLNIEIDSTEKNTNFGNANNIKIYLCTPTDATKDAVWRHANTFPILRTLLADLMAALAANRYINVTSRYIPRITTELFFMGTEGKNQNKLNDFVDAIEINIPQIKIKDLNYC